LILYGTKTKRNTRKTRKTRKIGGVNIHKLRSAIAESRTPTFSDKEELIEAVNGYCGIPYTKNKVVTKYGDIKYWNVSNITDMSELFKDKNFFNEDISGWDVSNVTNMSWMFANATSFNQPLNSWDVSNVKDMSYMFANATSFNQPLNDWNVSKDANLRYMFSGETGFYQHKYTINHMALNLFTIPNDIDRNMLESMFMNMFTGQGIVQAQKKILEQKRLHEFARASHKHRSLRDLQPEILSYIVGDEKASELMKLAAEKRKQMHDEYHGKRQKTETSQTL